MSLSFNMKKNYLAYAEVLLIVLLASVPLFVTFPYRVNIFVSWEGAYRMSEGQLPFRDFGVPNGGMYWVIPAIFFKLFGPQLITLVKAQVFINIISGLAFRSIMKSLGVQPGIRFVAVLLYCLSFSFFNFWPWYNHSVIVYQFVGLAFLFKGLQSARPKHRVVMLVLAGVFTSFSFLTKQDAGALAFLLASVLTAYACLQDKNWKPLFIYVLSFGVSLLLIILPFLKHGFGYWFNHGQPPHTARISAFEIVDEFFTYSQWIKFYLFIIVLILLIRYKDLLQLWKQRTTMLLVLLVLGLLGEAALFQVTSYTPPDNNIFFHSFAIALIITLLADFASVDFSRLRFVAIGALGIMLWWSSVYWKYIQRIASRVLEPSEQAVSTTGENVVNKQTFMIHPVDTTDVPVSDWVYSDLKSFAKVYMPKSTVDGMKRVMSMDVVKNNKNLRVLNMTELTPLAAEIPFELDRGSEFPLWHHLGVGMFNRQAELFEKKIGAKDYDLVLFEYVPSLNNFYPFRVRDSLKVHYNQVDSFLAPRRGDTRGMVEVYVK